MARAIHYGNARHGEPFVVLDWRQLPQDVHASMDSRTRALALLFGHAADAFPEATEDREASSAGRRRHAVSGRTSSTCRCPCRRAWRAPSTAAAPAGSATAWRCPSTSLSSRPAARARKTWRQTGRLHEQLAARLVQRLQLPTLAQRGDDIPGLARYFAAQTAEQLGRPVPEVTAADVAALQEMDLPGNVPQLQDLVEQAVVASGGGRVDAEHLGTAAATAA